MYIRQHLTHIHIYLPPPFLRLQKKKKTTFNHLTTLLLQSSTSTSTHTYSHKHLHTYTLTHSTSTPDLARCQNIFLDYLLPKRGCPKIPPFCIPPPDWNLAKDTKKRCCTTKIGENLDHPSRSGMLKNGSQ